MGQTVCEAVRGDPSSSLVAAVDPRIGRGDLGPIDFGRVDFGGVVTAASLDGLTAATGSDVALDAIVDFSVAAGALETARWCAAQGVHLVTGTTGLDEAALEEFGRLFGEGSASNCVLSANFAISAVLMLHLAELAAPHFDSIEIVELHHDDKRDAPSGTALETARLLAAARRAHDAPPLRPDPTTEERLAGARGGEGPGGVRIHSVRLRGLVAHEEVLFGAAGQTLTIRQDSFDRTSFMPGVLLALREVASRPGLTIGIAPLLGL